MVPDADPVAPAESPSLFVESAAARPVAGTDAVVCAVCAANSGYAQSDAIIWRISPGDVPPPQARVCVAEGGLAAAAELAASNESLCVVPRAMLRRANRNYGFSSDSSGSGFHTFQLDPASATGFVASDGGQDVPLSEWLHRADALGFSEIWLQAAEAGATSELLALAHRTAPQALFWVSASGLSQARFEAISTMPGLAALVLLEQDLARFGPILAALPPEACAEPGVA